MNNDGANKKRATERQLTKDNYKDNDDDQVDQQTKGDEDGGDFARATDEELKGRVIRRVKRVPAAPTSSGQNPFANVSLTKPTTGQESKEQDSTATEDVEQVAGATERAVTPDPKPSQQDKSEEGGEKSDVKSAASSSIFGSVFKTPSSFAVSLFDAGGSSTPMETSVDISKLQPLDQVLSGEESEETKYSEKSALFINTDGKWKAIGRGELRINLHKDGGARLLMRHEVTMKVILNARLYPEMKTMTMGNDAVSFSCQNNVEKADSGAKEGEAKYDIIAVRFKQDSKTKVDALMAAIDEYKTSEKKSTDSA